MRLNWAVIACSIVDGGQCFGGTCCLHLQGTELECSVRQCKYPPLSTGYSVYLLSSQPISLKCIFHIMLSFFFVFLMCPIIIYYILLLCNIYIYKFIMESCADHPHLETSETPQRSNILPPDKPPTYSVQSFRETTSKPSHPLHCTPKLNTQPSIWLPSTALYHPSNTSHCAQNK
jgi:hypothetical protein